MTPEAESLHASKRMSTSRQMNWKSLLQNLQY